MLNTGSPTLHGQSWAAARSGSSSVTVTPLQSPTGFRRSHSLGSSPGSPGSGTIGSCLSAAEKRRKYLMRLLKLRHMDFEYAGWQMLNLFIAPQKVYRNFQYRKQTRDQWARDDPAFLVLLMVTLVLTTLGFGLVLGLGFGRLLLLLIWVIVVDCVGVGLLVATAAWALANRFLRIPGTSSPEVEWAYAFDVHLNAFFPLIVILHLMQLPFLYSIIYHKWFVSSLLGNTFWLIAVIYYIYITFLGYSCLPFLQRTRVMLYPMTLAVILYVISVALRINLTEQLSVFYRYRIRDGLSI